MEADRASYELGLAAAVAENVETTLQQVLGCCACGAFRRQAFVRGLQHAAAQQLEPLRLLQFVGSCMSHGLFDLQLLQAVLPDPVKACSAIHKACYSKRSGWSLALPSAPVQQLVLQLLLTQHLDDENSDQQQLDMQPGKQGEEGLQQYIAATLLELQQAATQHQVLAVALFEAAAACVPLTGAAAPGRWMRSQIHGLIAQDHASAVIAFQQLAGNIAGSWEFTAAGHDCWQSLLCCVLSCIDVQDLLQEVLAVLQAAVMTVQGQDNVCAVLAAVCSCHGAVHRGAAIKVLAQAVTSALRDATLMNLMPPLLVAQQLLMPEEYVALLQAAAAAALLAKDASNAGPAGWSCCTKALRLLLPASSMPVLQANLQVLDNLQRAAPTAQLRQDVASTADDLRSVAAIKAQQQTGKKQQGASVKLNTNYQLKLSMFAQQQPSLRTGRREVLDQYAGPLGAQWARQFADALMQPPDDAYWARIRWEYLQGLEDRGLLAGRADRFRDACQALGIDLEGAADASGAGASEAPLMVLKQLLSRLPSVVREQMELIMLHRMFGRMTELLTRVLQQEQQQQEPPAHPPAKRQHLDASHSSSSSHVYTGAAAAAAGAGFCLQDHLVDVLLQAHDSTLTQPGGLSLDWRLAFLQLLQSAAGIHCRLVMRLQQSVVGAAAECSQAQVCCHGRLLALMAASTLGDVLVLEPRSDALLLSQAAATPMFIWQLQHSSDSSGGGCGGGGGAPHRWAPGSLTGFQLVEHLMSHTALSNSHQRCCAASFWAGYVSELQRLQSWCGGRYGPFHIQINSEQQQLLGYAPTQLVALLQAVAAQLAAGATSEADTAAEAAAAAATTPAGATTPSCRMALSTTQQGPGNVLRAAQKACSGALRSQPMKWVCQFLE